MKNIHICDTFKKSRISSFKNQYLYLHKIYFESNNNETFVNKIIVETNNNLIKPNDFYLNIHTKTITRCSNQEEANFINQSKIHFKIIKSTCNSITPKKLFSDEEINKIRKNVNNEKNN